MSRLAVVGAGAWGTALALQAVRAGHDVTLVARDLATSSALRASGTNARLAGHQLPAALEISDAIPSAPDLILWVVPMQELRPSFLHIKPPAGPIVACAKGLEIQTHLLPLEVISLLDPARRLAVLTGPNFAHEVANQLPSAAVVASADKALQQQIQSTLATRSFRLYGNDDPIGAQLGGAAKNVIAIAAGAVIGAGLGENARAALITRGLSELRRLAAALGGRAETMMGLAGLGDLLLTCTGQSSRNFSLGHALGQGESLNSILAQRSAVTEGVTTAAALVSRAGEIELPICRTVVDLLEGATTLDRAIQALMSRPQRDE